MQHIYPVKEAQSYDNNIFIDYIGSAETQPKKYLPIFKAKIRPNFLKENH